jgi:hypothetical protein
MRRPQIAVAALALVVACSGPSATHKTPTGLPAPNRTLTPGETIPGVTAAQVCTKGWAGAHRNVPVAEKKAVFLAYGADWAKRSLYEVDHLISLELGGTNSTRNLWPQVMTENDPKHPPDKDALENHLHALVCAGKVPLGVAQKAIAKDWVAAYARYMVLK